MKRSPGCRRVIAMQSSSATLRGARTPWRRVGSGAHSVPSRADWHAAERRLRSRLIRRGLVPIALESFLIEGTSAAVPEILAKATVQAAVALAAGKMAVAGAVSVSAAAHASSVTSSMRMAMMQRIAFGFAAVSIAIGVGFVANNAHSEASAPAPAAGAVQPQLAEELERGRTLHLQASSKADGSPLAGATVWVRATRGRIHTWEGTTDDQGRYALVLPGQATDPARRRRRPCWLRDGWYCQGSRPNGELHGGARAIGDDWRHRPRRGGSPDRGGSSIRHALQVQPDLAGDLRESEPVARHRDDQCPGALAGRCPADEFRPGRHATGAGDTPGSHHLPSSKRGPTRPARFRSSRS